MKNGLYVVATPIGNLADISGRALEVLAQADVIACEDTRVTRKLFGLLNLSAAKPFITYQDHNEEQQAQNLINLIQEGKSLALVSDAGSPLISDPGYKLIRKCREQQITVRAAVRLFPHCSFRDCRPTVLCLPVSFPIKIKPAAIFSMS